MARFLSVVIVLGVLCLLVWQSVLTPATAELAALLGRRGL